MGQILASIIKPLVEVRPGERMKTLLMFLYFFLTISLIYLLKPVQKSLFIDEFGAESLRYAYMAEGIFLIFWVSLYVQTAKRVPHQIFYAAILGFFLSNLIGFWFLFRTGVPKLSAFFYVWQAAFSITTVTVFWTLANDLFNADEAKRLFGIIICGGSAGGIMGGMITSQVVKWFQTEDLLLVASFVLLLCIVIVTFMWKRVPHVNVDERDEEASGSHGEGPGIKRSTLMAFLGSKYLIMLCAIVVIAKMTATVVDNQFGGIVEINFQGKEAMAAFYGKFFSILNGLSFMLQLFVTSVCLRYLGVGFSIWILPAGLAVLSIASFIHPVLLTGMVLKLYDGSVNYSVQQASKEVLYLPVPSGLRRRVKPLIDMLGYRAAKSFGGLYIAVAAPLFGLSSERLGVLAFALIPIWGVIAWAMRRRYSELLREHVLSKGKFEEAIRTANATDVLGFLHSEKNFEEVKHFMNGGSSYARKLSATAYLAYARSSRDVAFAHRFIRQLVEQEAVYHEQEIRSTDGKPNEQDFRMLKGLLGAGKDDAELETRLRSGDSTVIMKLGAVLQEPDKELEAKRRSVRILESIPRQESVDLLLHTLAATRDHAFRFVMIRALEHLYRKNPKLEINRFLIKSEIAREAAIHERIQKIHHFYRTERPSVPEDDYLETTLRAVSDESIERVFLYLSILYPREMMTTIHDRIMKTRHGGAGRVHARELLANTLDPDLALVVQRVLDETAEPRYREKEIEDILKRFSRSHDRWFSLIGYCLIGELKLGERWEGLRDLGEKPDLAALMG